MTVGQGTYRNTSSAAVVQGITRKTIHSALEEKALAPLAEGIFGLPLLYRLVKGLDTVPAKKPQLVPSKPKKQYRYARVRVKRCDGVQTTVSLSEPLYALHCEVLGRKQVHTIIRQAAFEENFRDRPPTLSAKIRKRLIANARDVLKTQALCRWYERKLTPLLPAPPKPKLTAQERRKRYKNTSYKKTYLTVGVHEPKQGLVTAVSVGVSFYGRACAILGRDEVHKVIRRSSRTYKRQSGSTRSEHARKYVVKHIHRLVKDTHLIH